MRARHPTIRKPCRSARRTPRRAFSLGTLLTPHWPLCDEATARDRAAGNSRLHEGQIERLLVRSLLADAQRIGAGPQVVAVDRDFERDRRRRMLAVECRDAFDAVAPFEPIERDRVVVAGI